MIFLTGDTRSTSLVQLLQSFGFGRMVIEKRIRPYPGEPWGFDNGAYRDFLHGRIFDKSAFLKRLDMARDIGEPYLAVCPDIVKGGEKSLSFSCDWIKKLPEWPWYLAVQDGMNYHQVRAALRHPFTGIFIGGSNEFKHRTAWMWANLAHEFDLKCHYGRCGTAKKILHAKSIGADSADSAFPLWTVKRRDSFFRDVTDCSQTELGARV